MPLHSRWFALLVAALLVAPACSKSPSLPDSDEDPSAYSAFPGPRQAASERDAPLEVVSARPRSRVSDASVISLSFNQPMVESALGETSVDEPIFQIRPSIEGEFSWMGSRTAVFYPNQELPPATNFKVTVPAGIESRDGARLERDYSFDFHTPYLRVTRTKTYPDHDRLRPDGKIMVFFNQDVTVEAFREAVTLRMGPTPVEFSLERSEDTGYGQVGFDIRAKGGFEFGRKYTVSIDASLKSAGANTSLGEGMRARLSDDDHHVSRSERRRFKGDSYRVSYQTYGDFFVEEISCGYHECRPNDRLRIHFTNPIDADTIEECLSISGSAKVSNLYASGRRVYFSVAGAEAGSKYTIEVDRDCRDTFGNSLQIRRSQTVRVPHPRPAIVMETGLRVLERGDASTPPAVPVTLQSVDDAQLRIFAVPDDQLAAVLSKQSSDKQLDEELIKRLGRSYSRQLGSGLAEGAKKTYPIDLRKVLGNRQTGTVLVQVETDQLENRWDNGRRRAVISVTDLGVNIKQSGSENLAWVTRLSDATPVEAARVSLWTSGGEKLWQGNSNAAGLVETPGRRALDGRNPGVMIVTKGDDTTFVDLDSWRGSIWPYRFDLNYDRRDRKYLTRNFIFTERGVYRAGETAHVKGYMRLDDGEKLREMPAERAAIFVSNPRGEQVLRAEVELTDLGGFSVDVPLQEDASLGTYTVKAKPVDAELAAPPGAGEKGSFRVEAYRTPEFEVLVEPEQDEMLVGKEAQVDIRGRYLFGAPMRNAKVRWSVRRQRDRFEPSRFRDYSFDAQRWRWWWYYDRSDSRRMESGSGKLSNDGLLEADFEVPRDEDFAGPQKLEIEASIRDVNRQQLSGRATVRVHPGEYYVGVRQANYLVEADKPIEPTAVAVDYDGEPLTGKPITMRIKRRTWKTVRKKAAGGGYTWVSEHVDEKVDSCKFTSAATAKSCKFDLDGPGSYIVEATSTDAYGNTLTSASPFYAYGSGSYWWGRDDDERIDLVTDASEYKVGQTAKVMVKSPFDKARALVTVERGTVLEQYTTEIDSTAGVVEVPITEKMQPNAYVSVALVRGRVDVSEAQKKRAGDDEADLGRPAFKIGYAELKVDHSDKNLEVSVTPDSLEYRPGGLVRAEVEVRDHTGSPTAGEVTFMAVDQGVLSLTGYKTPDPVDAFFANRALGVRNRDNRLMLTTRAELEQEAKKAEGMKADAGGGGSGRATNYRSEFATTATYRDTIEVGDDGKASVEFRLPENLTAYRLMAVAAATDNRFGSGEKRVEVNKPLMARPALPRFASTGDVFEARAVIQSMSEAGGKVRVDVKTDGPLELTGETSTTIALGAGANREVAFPVRAGAPGEATVRFVARGQGELAGEDAVELQLPIKYPAAQQSYVESGSVTMDSSWGQSDMRRRLELPDGIRKDVGGLEIELSSTQMGELLPGLEYLVGYPYGCVEQTTGRTLPLVSMREVVGRLDLPGLDEESIGAYAQSGLDRLFSMQTRDGGLGYWPGASRSHPWASAYGGLAIVRAHQSGKYDIDRERYDKLLGYLKTMLREEVRTEEYWHGEAMMTSRAFAAWVLALAGVPEPSYHSRLYEARAKMPRFGGTLLAMAIHEAGDDKQMRDTLVEESLRGTIVRGGAATLDTAGEATERNWMLMHSDTRSNAMALMALLQMRPNDTLIPKFAQGLLQNRTRGHWGNTQSTAFSVLALADYFERIQAVEPDYHALVGVGGTEFGREVFDKRELTSRRIFIPMEKLVEHEGKVLTIARRGPGGPMYYTATLTYADAEPPKTARDAGFYLQREYYSVDGEEAGEPIEQVSPGQVVMVRLTLTAPEQRGYVAIEDPLPAGFEPINTAFETTSKRLKRAVEDGRKSRWWWYWRPSFDHTEQHDDKVLLFANRLSAGVYRHSYLARATTPGTFTAPAARVEAMYEPEFFGRSNAREVEVR